MGHDLEIPELHAKSSEIPTSGSKHFTGMPSLGASLDGQVNEDNFGVHPEIGLSNNFQDLHEDTNDKDENSVEMVPDSLQYESHDNTLPEAETDRNFLVEKNLFTNLEGLAGEFEESSSEQEDKDSRPLQTYSRIGGTKKFASKDGLKTSQAGSSIKASGM